MKPFGKLRGDRRRKGEAPARDNILYNIKICRCGIPRIILKMCERERKAWFFLSFFAAVVDIGESYCSRVCALFLLLPSALNTNSRRILYVHATLFPLYTPCIYVYTRYFESTPEIGAKARTAKPLFVRRLYVDFPADCSGAKSCAALRHSWMNGGRGGRSRTTAYYARSTMRRSAAAWRGSLSRRDTCVR